MAFHRGLKLPTGGLVSVYDPINIKSFRGEPTINLLYDNGVINWTIVGLGGSSVTRTTIVPNSVYRITHNSGLGQFRFIIPLSKLTNGKTYNLSYKYKFISGSTFRMNDWCDDVLLTNRVNWDFNDYLFSSAAGTRATYDNICRFMDFNMVSGTTVEIWDIQLEERAYFTPFTNDIRGSIVSTGGGLLDLGLRKNNCEFVDNISFDINSKSIVFNGSSDMITGSTNNFNITTGLTLSCWFKANTTQGSFPRLIGVDGSWMIYLQSTQNYRMAFFGSSIDASFPNTTGYNDNKWHNVVVSYGGNGINCYVDGVSHGTISKTGSLNSVGDTPFSIGGRVGESRFFNGNISHVMVYNKPLTENEILEIYNATKSRFGL